MLSRSRADVKSSKGFDRNVMMHCTRLARGLL